MGATYDAQAAADKECRRLCKLAKEQGGNAPYSLSRIIDAKVPLSTIRKVLRQTPQAKPKPLNWGFFLPVIRPCMYHANKP